jgi:N-acetylmuramoyl-L-alanine amidase
VVRPYLGNVPAILNLQNTARGNVPADPNANPRVQRQFLDRSEILARQAFYLNRNQVNPATVPGTQNTLSTDQLRGRGRVDVPDQGIGWTRRHQVDQNGSPDNNAANGGHPDKSHTTIPATNLGRPGGKPVLSFNNANTMNFNDACRRHHDHHDRDWWRNHCHTIILIGGGFYAWDLGYWYPAYGYDSYNSSYAYDGPIYGYDGLPPDQIIANVQYALQQLGYYSEAVDGVLGWVTRQAIEDYQVENGLNVTGAIDRPTLVALGFID